MFAIFCLRLACGLLMALLGAMLAAVIDQGSFTKISGYIDEAKKSPDAEVLVGGKCDGSKGWFIEPTVIVAKDPKYRSMREEIFGPVLTVTEFEDEAEALRLANDTPYGLAASIYTTNVNTAHRMARAVKAGTVGINAYSEGDMTTPFGGYKQSGFGGHDKSVHAHDQYTELKTIWLQLSGG
jgi:gamma-glutamyl-gamma-aminobutyraldehyde dehydrogenase